MRHRHRRRFEGPGLVGSLCVAIVLFALVTALPMPADAHGEEDEIRVEALVHDASAPLVIEYGVLAPPAATGVSLAATSDKSATIGSVALGEVSPGVFRGVVTFPEAGTWKATVVFEGVGAETTFTEALPWPHYTTEAGSPKIKVDSGDPSLEGSLIDITLSPIFGHVEPDPAAPGQDNQTGAGVQGAGPEVALQVILRWLHLAGIGFWGVSVAVIGLRRRNRLWAGLAVGGMVGTVATGTALTLWGAPLAFPGLIRWSELADRVFGVPYQWAFLVKMAFVLAGIVATSLLVAKTTRARFAVATSGIVGALGAVVVMGQLHLYVHL